ncbi:EcsC family protein [Angelakisella massiliensis]|uniref:EcsC family protein n=1 Tax=Angelakisella massiliensis TaxID=1871018 RepID=UPI0008F8A95A|nr:EcsC family protein [Angelakisella massiliensis]
MKKDWLLQRELNRMQRKENKKLLREADRTQPGPVERLGKKVEQHLPSQGVAAAEAAFQKGFGMLFEQGLPLVEKTAGGEKRRLWGRENARQLEQEPSLSRLKEMDRQARGAMTQNQAVTLAEGGGLGLLGVGIPDIPLFLGMMLRTLCQIGASYGFDFQSPGERLYLLSLIRLSVSKGKERLTAAQETDRLAHWLDGEGAPPQEAEQESIARTSHLLAGQITSLKLLQGVPVVGVLGGAANLNILTALGETARLKYRQRRLRLLQNGKGAAEGASSCP